MATDVEKFSPHQKNVISFRALAENPSYANRFKQVLDDRAPQFLASLVQLVSGSDYLAACEPNSIMAAAITSASLDLPIDKNLGFAHIVPYAGKAQFQLGYKGFIQLAIRTGQYKLMNCCVVYEGELVKYDELTAELVIDSKKRTSEKPIGYAAYFKLMNGFEHAEFWYREEVDAHALKYSQAYAKKKQTPWFTDFDTMALKTVIKSLISKWGIMSIKMQTAVIHDQGVRASVDSDAVFYPDNEVEIKRPLIDGPATDVESTVEQVAGAAGATKQEDKQPALTGESLTNAVLDLAKADGVTEGQVLAYCTSMKPPLCGADIVEVRQISDANLRLLHTNWKHIIKNIKAQKA